MVWGKLVTLLLRRALLGLGFRAAWLIPRPLAHVISDLIALAGFLVARRSRRHLTDNLVTVFPEKSRREIRAIVFKSFLNLGRNITEVFRMHRSNKRALTSRFEPNTGHMNTIRTEHARGRGIIVATGHFCSWEIAAAPLTDLLGELHSIALPYGDPSIDRFFVRARSVIDNHTIMLANASRESLRVLRQKKPLVIMSDRAYTKEGIELDFFGRPVLFPTGVAQFAIKFKCPIVTYFIVRTGGARFKILSTDPIRVPDTGTKEERMVSVMRDYVRILERVIRDYPEFWVAFYRVWERSMPGTRHLLNPGSPAR